MEKKLYAKKLMSWDTFVDTFKPNAEKWHETPSRISIIYKGMKWIINDPKKRLFGKYIAVEPHKSNTSYSYNYRGRHGGSAWHWHDSWFEPEFELLTEEDVLI